LKDPFYPKERRQVAYNFIYILVVIFSLLYIKFS